MAAQQGKLKTLKWQREQGCPWDGEVYMQAIGRGHPETLAWAHQNNCPCPHSPISTNIVTSNLWFTWHMALDLIAWVHAHGCLINKETQKLLTQCRYDLALWKNRIAIDQDMALANQAVPRGNIDALATNA